jgi:protease YdgD
LQQACSVLGNREGLIALDCDVSFGTSGAPVLGGSTDRARIVSFIASGSAEGGPAMAIGMDLPDVVSQLKDLLRDGKPLSEADELPAEPRMLGGDGQDRDIGARFVKP